MGKLADFLTGITVLEEVDSTVNGKIKVVKGIAFGTYIQVEGLTQSGGILKNVWRKPLKKISNYQLTRLRQGFGGQAINNVLILGLGGGTVAGLVREFWPEAKITGVDLDPVMVELGRKYLRLDDYDVKIFIDDAEKFLNTKYQILNTKYNLILIDLYIGREYPKKFENEKFLLNVEKFLDKDGIAIFNRLYYGEKRSDTVRFGKKLEKIFSKVEAVYPEANIMYLCS